MGDKMAKSDDPELGMTTQRIENLTDGIYSIAMTLLVLNLALPEMGVDLTPSTELHELLSKQTHEFLNYILSFILLAIFWSMHHQQFHFIKRTDHTHLWINVFILMFVAMVPFTTSLIGDYPDETIAKLFFGLNLFILGSLNALNWTYATKNYRLVDRGLNPRRIAVGNRRDAVIPGVILLAMVLSLITPHWSPCTYLLIPIMLAHPWFRHKKP